MLAILAVILLFTGCSSGVGVSRSEPVSSAENSAAAQSETSQTEKTTEPPDAAYSQQYTVPDGWMKADQYSTSEKTFYIQEGHENEKYPDNISINLGTNRYSEEEHTKFREAIVRQLLGQWKGVEAQLNGDGTYTKQGYVLYTFTIEEDDVTTKQYYIVKDYGFCLIHVTNFSQSEHVYEAAQTMVDSFVWKTED